jgi:hypothetical protein
MGRGEPGGMQASLEERLQALALRQQAEGERIREHQGAGANGVANDFEQPDTLAPAVQRLIRLSVKTRTTLAQEIGIAVLTLERAARGEAIDTVAEAKLREFLRCSAPSPRLVSGGRR